MESAPKKAGIDKTRVHTSRHSAATGWLESGVNIKAVADLLGHASIAITGDIYSQSTDDTRARPLKAGAGRWDCERVLDAVAVPVALHKATG